MEISHHLLSIKKKKKKNKKFKTFPRRVEPYVVLKAANWLKFRIDNISVIKKQKNTKNRFLFFFSA